MVHFLFLSFPVGKIEKRRSFVVGFRARARDVVVRGRAEGAGGEKEASGPTYHQRRPSIAFEGLRRRRGKKSFRTKEEQKMERRE